jgi:hypothetical protein
VVEVVDVLVEVVGARLVLVVDVVDVVIMIVVLVVVVVPEVEVVVLDVDDEVVDGVTVLVDVTVVVEVTVLVVVEVVEPAIVLVVVVGGAGQASPAGRGLQTKVNLSLSVFFLASNVTLPLPGLFCCLPFTGTGKSTKALQAELRSLGKDVPTSIVPAVDLALPLAFVGVRVVGSQPATPVLFTQAAMLNVHEPFGVAMPSRSHAGSQSVQAMPCFLPFLLMGTRSSGEYPSRPM